MFHAVCLVCECGISFRFFRSWTKMSRERERENHLIACLSSLWDKFEGQAVIVYYFDLALYYKSFINKSVMNAMYLKVSHFQSGVYEWEAWCLPTPTRKRKFLLSYRTVTIKLLLLACFKYSICAAICHYTLYHFICSLESFIYCNNFFFFGNNWYQYLSPSYLKNTSVHLKVMHLNIKQIARSLQLCFRPKTVWCYVE